MKLLADRSLGLEVIMREDIRESLLDAAIPHWTRAALEVLGSFEAVNAAAYWAIVQVEFMVEHKAKTCFPRQALKVAGGRAVFCVNLCWILGSNKGGLLWVNYLDGWRWG